MSLNLDVSSELIDALKDLNIELATQLISTSDVNIINRSGFTALFYAVRNRYKDICLKLIKHGANVNFKNYFGFTALHIAETNKYYDIYELLIDNGFDINYPNFGENYTPLISAIKMKDIQIIDILLKKGVDINLVDWYNHTPLMFAAMSNNEEICKKILEHEPILDCKNVFNQTALFIAVARNFNNIVRILINAGANQNILGLLDQSPLHIAVSNGFFDICQALNNNDANYDFINTNNGDTLLHTACRIKNLEIAKFLTEHMKYDFMKSLNNDGKSVLEVWGNAEYNRNPVIIIDADKNDFIEHFEALFTDMK